MEYHWIVSLQLKPQFGLVLFQVDNVNFGRNHWSSCHAPKPSIKIGTWQLLHTHKVSTLQVCNAFLATKIYPQKSNQINPKYLNNFFVK